MCYAMDVAKYILWYCTQKGAPISNLKLQKILYFAWIDYYNVTATYLFSDNICAWQFGPVVPNVYYNYCQYSNLNIYINDKPLVAVDLDVLNIAIDNYRTMTVSALVKKSHQAGKPWYEIYKNGSGNRQIIPFDLIKRLECAENR